MQTAAGVFTALSDAVVFLNHFKDLPDPRQVVRRQIMVPSGLRYSLPVRYAHGDPLLSTRPAESMLR
jgi:hypothetical protein